jgi:hypothetical protein
MSLLLSFKITFKYNAMVKLNEKQEKIKEMKTMTSRRSALKEGMHHPVNEYEV